MNHTIVSTVLINWLPHAVISVIPLAPKICMPQIWLQNCCATPTRLKLIIHEL